MGASTAFQGLRHPARAPEQAPCGFCRRVIQLTFAQQRWLRWHPGQHVFCNQQCCNKHYQEVRRQKPNGRQEEYQRYIRERRAAREDETQYGFLQARRHRASTPGGISATDQDYLGGGWSWWRLPDYGAYRCTCRRGWTCDACRTWREPKEAG